MAMTKCKECGNKVSNKAKQCPSCGVAVKKKTGCGALVFLVVVGLFIVGGFASLIADKSGSSPRTPAPPRSESPLVPAKVDEAAIKYTVVKSWNIPNGGTGKTIAIAPAHANEQDMTVLAHVLKKDARSDRNALIQVFTSSEAARMRDRLSSLSEGERAIYQSAYVGRYQKNGNIGLEEMEIHPEGMNGPSKMVKP